jgi:hypothetical protein
MEDRSLLQVRLDTLSCHECRSDWILGETKAGWEDFGELFLTSFNSTNVFEVWDRVTDPILFDLVDPK